MDEFVKPFLEPICGTAFYDEFQQQCQHVSGSLQPFEATLAQARALNRNENIDLAPVGKSLMTLKEIQGMSFVDAFNIKVDNFDKVFEWFVGRFTTAIEAQVAQAFKKSKQEKFLEDFSDTALTCKELEEYVHEDKVHVDESVKLGKIVRGNASLWPPKAEIQIGDEKVDLATMFCSPVWFKACFEALAYKKRGEQIKEMDGSEETFDESVKAFFKDSFEIAAQSITEAVNDTAGVGAGSAREAEYSLMMETTRTATTDSIARSIDSVLLGFLGDMAKGIRKDCEKLHNDKQFMELIDYLLQYPDKFDVQAWTALYDKSKTFVGKVNYEVGLSRKMQALFQIVLQDLKGVESKWPSLYKELVDHEKSATSNFSEFETDPNISNLATLLNTLTAIQALLKESSERTNVCIRVNAGIAKKFWSGIHPKVNAEFRKVVAAQ